MEFDALSVYQQNAQRLKIRESTCYSVLLQEQDGVVVSCTDFGHIHVHSHDIQGVSPENEADSMKKTLYIENPPIFSSQLLYLPQLNGMQECKFLICGGSKNSLKGFAWNKVLNASHESTLVPDIDISLGSKGIRDTGNIIAIVHAPAMNNCVYVANDMGRIFCCDINTGNSLMDSDSLSAPHRTQVHSLRLVGDSQLLLSCDAEGIFCIWDAMSPGKLISKCDLSGSISESLGVSRSRIWLSSLDVDLEGNFAYVGGGIEAANRGSSKGSNVFHRACAGWLASFFLSDPYDCSGENVATLVKCSSHNTPLQSVFVHGDKIVSGGAQPVLAFWTAHSLEIISSMQTSSQSIFTIAGCDVCDVSGQHTQLLAVGGTVPVVDLISVVGHKAAVLYPP